MKESFDREKPLLNDWDRKKIGEGVLNVSKTMYKDFGNSLPDGIVFIDTAARPLMYAFNPVFRRIAESHNLKMPKYYLMTAISTPNELIPYQFSPLYFNENNDLIEPPSDTEQVLGKKVIETEEEYRRVANAKGEKTRDIDFEHLQSARSVMKSRASEILQKLSLHTGSDARIAVIDDMESNGGTFDEVRIAFEKEKLPLYSVMSVGKSWDQKSFSGTAQDDDSDINPSTGGITFSYKGTPAVGVEKTDEQGRLLERSSIIGNISNNEKGERKLRLEMLRLGSHIAGKIESELTNS